jgi:signal transduction histidine kinase
MERLFKKTRRDFTIATIAVAMLCAVTSGGAVYLAAQDRLNNPITAERLSELSHNNAEVSKYLDSQQAYHAHFESIATIIQEEEQRQIKQVLPWIIGWVAGISAVIGWFLAQRLLSPVREAYLAQRRFLQDAAHELRNPLAAMQSMLQSTKQLSAKNAASPKLLTSLETHTKHLSNITSELLLLEHQEQAGNENTDIAALLQDVTEELYYLAQQKKVTIQVDSPDVLQARITPQHFVHIAHNLVENAVKFSKANGEVNVKLSGSNHRWRLEVKDKGIGIPAADQPEVSSRFFRARNATRVDGTGLGLAIVQKFAKLYGAKVHITSRINHGTTIIVDSK